MGNPHWKRGLLSKGSSNSSTFGLRKRGNNKDLRGNNYTPILPVIVFPLLQIVPPMAQNPNMAFPAWVKPPE